MMLARPITQQQSDDGEVIEARRGVVAVTTGHLGRLEEAAWWTERSYLRQSRDRTTGLVRTALRMISAGAWRDISNAFQAVCER